MAAGVRVDAQAPAPVATHGIVIGEVVDAASGAALGGAQVSGAALRGDVVAGNDGRFTVTVAAGTPTLVVRRLGYAPRAFTLTLAAGDTLRVRVPLEAVARLLDTVAVSANAAAASARLGGYERRRASGRGTFITRAEIDARRPIAVSDIVRRVPSLTIMDSLGVKIPVSTRGRKVVMNRRGADAQAPCVMRVGVNGQVKEWGFSMNLLDPVEVHGIEVYSGPASIPAEFGGARVDAFCGLVMLWTRDR